LDHSPQVVVSGDVFALKESSLLSPDGRFVIYRSRKNPPVLDYNPSPTHSRHLRFWDRVTDTMGNLDNSVFSGSPTRHAPGKFFVTEGSRVIFESPQPNLVTRDGNRAMDVFAVELNNEDSDLDRMADDWEMAFFETLDRDGSGDADGDGVSDLGEYAAGTVPINSESVLSVTEVRTLETGKRVVFWRSVAGKRYMVLMRSTVDHGFWLIRSGVITATAETSSFVDAPAAGEALPDQRYYRVFLLE
jgi:hypothetical protein